MHLSDSLQNPAASAQRHLTCIEAFYNTKRIHTSIANQSPAEYEELMSSA